MLGVMVLPMVFGVARASSLYNISWYTVLLMGVTFETEKPLNSIIINSNQYTCPHLNLSRSHSNNLFFSMEGFQQVYHTPDRIGCNRDNFNNYPGVSLVDNKWTIELSNENIRLYPGWFYHLSSQSLFPENSYSIETINNTSFYQSAYVYSQAGPTLMTNNQIPQIIFYSGVSSILEITNITGGIFGQVENTYSAPFGPGLSYYIKTFIHFTSAVSGTNFTHETGLIGGPDLFGGTNVVVTYPYQASIGNNYFISYLFEINHLGVERLVATSPVRNFYVPVTTPTPPGWTPPAVTPIPTAPDIIAGLPTILQPIAETVNEMIGGLGNLFNSFVSNVTARFPFSWILGIRDVINQEAQDAVDVIRYPTLNITLPAFGNTASSTVDMLPVTALMTSTHIMGQPNQFPAIVTIFRNILLFSSWILFSLSIIKRVRSFTNNLGTTEKN